MRFRISDFGFRIWLPAMMLFVFVVLGWKDSKSEIRNPKSEIGSVFAAANDELAAGRHDGAIAGYEALLVLGMESPNLLYNAAVAYRRAGMLGRAILALERLLVLDPRDAEARRFLDDVRAQVGRSRPRGAGTGGLFPRRGLLHAASGRLREAEVAAAAVVLSFLTFGLLFARRFARREALRLGLAIAAPVSAVLLAVACVLLWSKAALEADAAEAVIIAPVAAAAREGPSTESPESFRPAEGDIVRVVGRAGGWSAVLDESGRRGWVAPGDVGEIFGPLVIPSGQMYGAPP